MAITPRTILSTPATAIATVLSVLAVAAVGLYMMSACSTSCSRSAQVATYEPEAPCEDVRQSFALNRAQWSEYAWYKYASCFDARQDSRLVVEVASQGLRFYPRSEALFNMKGYHQIKQQQYSEAIKTLELGMQSVPRQRTGTMANNLAWAGMWAPRELSLERSRQLYKASLDIESDVCETLHTGMWVEYAVAKQSTGLERAQALSQFNALSASYRDCHARYQDGSWDKLVEVLGAAVIMEDLGRDTSCAQDAPTDALMVEVSQELRARYRGASIDTLCREAVPMASAHHTCVSLIDGTVKELRSASIAHRLGRYRR